MTLEQKLQEVRKQGRRELAFELYIAKKLSLKEAADSLGLSEKEFLELFKEFQE